MSLTSGFQAMPGLFAQAADKGLWQRWLDFANTDNGRDTLLKFAANNLRSRAPGESSLSVFGESLSNSVDYLKQLEKSDADALMQEKLFGLKQQETDNSTRSTDANIEYTDASTKEKNVLLGGKVKKQKAETKYTNTSADRLAALLPGEVKQQGAQTQNIQANTNRTNVLLPGEVSQQGATLASTQAQTAKTGVDTQMQSTMINERQQKLDPEIRLIEAQIKALGADAKAALAKASGQDTPAIQKLHLLAENEIKVAANQGRFLNKDEALQIAFNKLEVNNPSLYNKELFQRYFTLKQGEAGAFLQGSPDLQAAVQNAPSTMAGLSFPQGDQVGQQALNIPVTTDETGKQVVDVSQLQHGQPYLTAQGIKLYNATTRQFE